MIVSAWRNSSAQKTTGTRFGLRLGKPLRDRLLNCGVKQVTLHLQHGPTLLVTLKEAFWNKCPEFKHPEIGPWMLSHGIPIPWSPGQPPKFRLVQHGPAEFEVRPIHLSAPSANL
ncbi:MAG TPA: hypothetical protein DCP71_01625 [Verrucomicrobiales bacterium]|nr:hypothetical protein [Verrucomicrobiales bacterium]